jgi:hypothetical protein
MQRAAWPQVYVYCTLACMQERARNTVQKKGLFLQTKLHQRQRRPEMSSKYDIFPFQAISRSDRIPLLRVRT